MGGRHSSPFTQASFPCVNLLPSANESDDNRPIGMTIHDFQDHLWFGDMPLSRFLSVLPPVLICIPGSLSFIEDDRMLVRRIRTLFLKIVFYEMMNILNECSNFTPRV